jgi:hypothetical protein
LEGIPLDNAGGETQRTLDAIERVPRLRIMVRSRKFVVTDQ